MRKVDELTASLRLRGLLFPQIPTNTTPGKYDIVMFSRHVGAIVEEGDD